MASPAAIEIGIGGDLTGLRSGPLGVGGPGDFSDQFAHLQELIVAYDPEATIQFIETTPPRDRAEEFCAAAARAGIPVRQFTALYWVGGSETQPDALVTLRANLALAKRAGTIDRLNMQVVGTSDTPTIDRLVEFYIRAEELAAEAGITLFTETHVDRFTYNPQRLIAVHRALQERTAGRLRIRVCADFSHYVHQLGNPHFANWEALSSGALNLDPFDPSNSVTQQIIETGMIGYGHLRMAVPNSLTALEGSIQYPVVDPAGDAEAPTPLNGGLPQPWDGERTKTWFEWYRQIFTYLLRHPERPVARFSTEFIGNGQPGEYRVDPYRNLYQNIAMVAVAQRLVRQIQRDLAAT